MLYDLRPNSLLADCLSVLTSENFTRHNKYMHIMAHARFGVSCTCAHMLYCVCGGRGSLFS